MPVRALLAVGALLSGLAAVACGGAPSGPPAGTSAPPAASRPNLLLVTLDTTRADAIGPDATRVSTPAFNALVSRGRRFTQAYATVPETLPSHLSMMTGLYPGGHGVHENARPFAGQPLLAERLKAAGYRTAAFVSAFPLARRFGIAKGFDAYDDAESAGRAERGSRETTEAVLAWLRQAPSGPLFVWVHYYDPHAPYEPPEPFSKAYADRPYLGEVAAMDEQLGRLVAAFETLARDRSAIVVAGDHGEGLGEHGESQHGYLIHQATMHVPLVITGPGVAHEASDRPVSTRRIFDTMLDWAGLPASGSLRQPADEVVLGEAMKPFLEFGWQPQVMGVRGRHKAVIDGRLGVYDVRADPGERQDIASHTKLDETLRAALYGYPLPSADAARPPTLDDEARKKLASLGYVSSGAPPVVRRDAPRPSDMTRLFPLFERASSLFTSERYVQAIPLLEQILAADPANLDATLRLATAHSSLGHDREALAAFEKASALAPRSQDVQLYLGLHYARGREWPKAVPLLERIVEDTPERLPALEALARIRERQDRLEDAARLWQQIHRLRPATGEELVRLGALEMQTEETAGAIDAFERARALQGRAFANDLELGVLYLDARRFDDARAALDRVPASHPQYAMALFKRAQVSVLLGEPDQAARIERARRNADATTRELIARERLFSRP